MTVRFEDDGIRLEGRCPIEDAEPLLQLAWAHPKAVIDWRGCDQAHTAIIQILLITKHRLVGPPASEFLRKHIESLLNKAVPDPFSSSGSVQKGNL